MLRRRTPRFQFRGSRWRCALARFVVGPTNGVRLTSRVIMCLCRSSRVVSLSARPRPWTFGGDKQRDGCWTRLRRVPSRRDLLRPHRRLLGRRDWTWSRSTSAIATGSPGWRCWCGRGKATGWNCCGRDRRARIDRPLTRGDLRDALPAPRWRPRPVHECRRSSESLCRRSSSPSSRPLRARELRQEPQASVERALRQSGNSSRDRVRLAAQELKVSPGGDDTGRTARTLVPQRGLPRTDTKETR